MADDHDIMQVEVVGDDRSSAARATVIMYGFVFIGLLCVALAATTIVLFGKQVDRNRALSRQLQTQVKGNHKLALEGAEAHHAICVLRKDLKRRIKADEERVKTQTKFLGDHPDGIPGISATLIKSGITAQQQALRNQRKTVKSLASIDCRKDVG